jgi:hypothetical protein
VCGGNEKTRTANRLAIATIHFHKNPSFKVDSHAPTLFLLAFVARMVAQTGVLALI